jgi:hypothetical protein
MQDSICWFFKTQIYPLGFEKLTHTIWSRLGLPVTVRTDLSPKAVKVLMDWVTRQTGTARV